MNHRSDLAAWRDKRVLITGVCGTVGKESLSQLVQAEPAEIIGLDNNETSIFFLEQAYEDHDNVRLSLGDVRDADKLHRKMEGIDVVLHTAAYKHVILCEKEPTDAVKTNILGTQNVIDAAARAGVERVLLTSSDKAVNPTNVMGTSKLMGERLMTAASGHAKAEGTVFASTRFGNVLGSRGSVIQIFKDQIRRGGPVTLTDPRMSRFIMTIQEAVRLIHESVFLAKGGEVFVTKMPAMRVEDLANVMIDELAPRHGHDPKEIEVKIIGAKPGEKMFEELMNEEETRRTRELDRYFAILPAFQNLYQDTDYTYPDGAGAPIEAPYNSRNQEPLGPEELRGYLLKNDII